jgi:sec-independent protein translocase protein TatC
MEDDKQGVPPPEGEGSPPVEPEVQPPAAEGEVPAPRVEVVTETSLIRRPPPPPPPPPVASPDDAEEDSMLRMSFMEHLEELRSRIIRALYGLGIAFVLALAFAGKLWDIVSDPAVEALKHLHVNPPRLAQLTPMESFSIIWVKLPLLCLAFRYGLEFLLGIGMSNNVQPVVSITEYFDLFVNVTLGVALVFELPVVIFLLTLLRLLSPRFLLRHSRYAILIIVIVAAIITPTPDVFNLMLFAIPMCMLYFVGVFAGLVLVMRREGRTMPWNTMVWIAVIVLLTAAAIAAAMMFYHVHLIPKWPYLTR